MCVSTRYGCLMRDVRVSCREMILNRRMGMGTRMGDIY